MKAGDTVEFSREFKRQICEANRNKSYDDYRYDLAEIIHNKAEIVFTIGEYRYGNFGDGRERGFMEHHLKLVKHGWR